MENVTKLNDPDLAVERLLSECDEILMPLPDFTTEPHLLISRVRKYYMDYVVQLLTANYEACQRLQHQDIQVLPSAIWRCAKSIEMKAAQKCMIVQIYRKHIGTVVHELKKDIKNRTLNERLYECLKKHPRNDKKIQTTFSKFSDCTCPCICSKIKRRRKNVCKETKDNGNLCKIPAFINMHSEVQNKVITKESNVEQELIDTTLPTEILNTDINKDYVSPKLNVPRPDDDLDTHDELMMQLDKLFNGIKNDDDLFESTLCTMPTENIFKGNSDKNNVSSELHNLVIESHAKQIKSLDEKLASLADMLVNNTKETSTQNEQTLQNQGKTQQKKQNPSKWFCEEYFLKAKLFEMLDLIGDTNRKKLVKIKDLFEELFGPDSDDETLLSPLEETPEFILSCKERIAPWVVKILTPVYTKGRIKGKALFKSLAKHLIKLIYQCSRYPDEYEVKSFVCDFLKSHKMIRCEADFHDFRIENL